MLDFVEPAQSEQMTWLAQTLWPMYAMSIHRRLDLRVSERVRDAFRQVENFPTLICPNHSAHEDPAVMFILSTLVHQQFRFLAARESFGAKNSPYAKWLQKIGCYSVERGAADAHAFKATRSLLTSGANKIVIFPEGEVTQQNNYLIEIETGPEHMGLSAIEDLKKHNREQDMFLMPLVLKYKFLKDVSHQLNHAATGIEHALGYKKQSNNLAERIRYAFFVVLDKNVPSNQASSLDNFEEKIAAFRQQLISDAQTFLKVDMADDLTPVHKIHLLKNKFAEKSWCYEEKPRFMHQHCKHCPSRTDRTAYAKLTRATNLLAVGNHSFDHELTEEETAELLTILQLEIFGRVTLKRPETVYIDAPEPINLRDYVQAYEADKKGGIETLKNELARRLNESLKVTPNEVC